MNFQIYFNPHFFSLCKNVMEYIFFNPALCHSQIAVLLTLLNRVIDRCV